MCLLSHFDLIFNLVPAEQPEVGYLDRKWSNTEILLSLNWPKKRLLDIPLLVHKNKFWLKGNQKLSQNTPDFSL
jgi:hypothetical protein